MPLLRDDPNFDPENTIFCTDGGYGKKWCRDAGFLDPLVPHRKPNDRPLSAAKVLDNDQLAEFRSDIERFFGKASTKFPWWKAKAGGYQGSEKTILIDIKTGINPLE